MGSLAQIDENCLAIDVDPAAEPADLDDAVAEFLITFFCRPALGSEEDTDG